MQLDNIQPRTSFKGGFVQNEVLQKAVQHAKKSDLKRFLQLQRNIESVNDNFLYRLNDITGTICVDKHANTLLYGREFQIELENINGNWLNNKFRCLPTYLIKPQNINIDYTDKFYKKLLKKVCSVIETDYPQFANKKSLHERLFDKLNL